MKRCRIRCAAKLNLSLDVTGRRDNGYHTLESIFQSVSVYDIIDLSVDTGDSIRLTCDVPGIPVDGQNLAYRAAAALLAAAGKQAAVSIRLHKEIPSGAGMGGGSADAAGVLWGLNRLLGCGLTDAQLHDIGTKLGADVPFLLLGGTAYAEGIGELLTPLPPLPALPVVIVKGTESISTPAAYRAIDTLTAPAHPDTGAMLQAVRTGDITLLCRSCGNLFEQAVDCAEVSRARQRLREQGAQCAVMTGSGAAVFGIFADTAAAAACAAALQGEFSFVRAAALTETSLCELPCEGADI